MPTENTIQVNDFAKGMNTDTSDAYLDTSAYRLANNLRYITNKEENSGELHMIEGAKYLCSIPNVTVNDTAVLRDLGIFITEGGNSDWQVWVIRNGESKPHCILKVDNEGRNRVVGKKISTVTRYEDSDNQKLYIADGEGPIIIVQLTDKDGNIVDAESTVYVKNITAYPSALLNQPKFAGLCSGKLKAGVVQYSYQLYNKHLNQSEISVATKMIPLRTGGLTVGDSSRISGYEQGKYTDKGIKITMDIQNQNFDHMFIYRITYEQAGQVPTIELIYDGKVVTEFEDYGRDALSVLTLEQYNSMTGIHIIPKTIESKDDYMFCANIKTDDVLSEKESIKNWDATKNVTYKFVVTELTGDSNSDSGKISIDGYGTFDATPRGYTFSESESNGRREVNIDLSDFIDEVNDTNNTYNNTFVSYSLKSLRRGEVYRYGIVLYDEDGNSTAVKYIGDITTPSFEDSPTFSFSATHRRLVVRPLGIRFTVNLPEGIKKYEIVRCNRDAQDMQTVTQCVLSRPIARVFDTDTDNRVQKDYPLTPTGLVTVQDYYSGINDINVLQYIGIGHDNLSFMATNFDFVRDGEVKAKGNYDIFQVVSPEYCYSEGSIKDIVKDNQLKIQKLAYITPSKQYHDTLIAKHENDEVSYSRYSIGNKYSNLTIDKKVTGAQDTNEFEHNKEDYIRMTSVYDTLSSYYDCRVDSDGRRVIEALEDSFDDWYTDKYKPNRYTYTKLYKKSGTIQQDTANITQTAFPDTLGWDDFASNEEEYKLKYVDRVTAIGGKNFVNWVSNGLFGVDSTTETGLYVDGDDVHQQKLNDEYLNDSDTLMGSMMGPGGKCFLVKLDNDKFGGIPEGTDNMFGTYLCNIIKNTVPYGGTSQNAIENSTYRSYGDLFDSTETSVDVFDGDCFIMPFEYISQHKWKHSYLKNNRTAMVAYSIPVETSINLAYTYGYELSKNIDSASGDITNIQVQPSNVNNQFIQDTPLYMYNAAYSSNPSAKTLMAWSEDEDNYNTNQDFRVYHSLPKSNNEQTDNWLKYMPANFLDVDNRHGEITGLRRFHNQLVFWQETATGILSVNERSQITDDSNMPLILGTGDVLGRFDYLNTSNGMRKDEYADTQSDSTLYWWDHNKREIVAYSGGLETMILSKVKFVQNLLNKYEDTQLLERPRLWHDKEFNEIVFNVSSGTGKEKGSLVYSEYLGQFTSLYGVAPCGVITFKDGTLLATRRGRVSRWNVYDTVRGALDENGNRLTPYLKYVVNKNALYTKVFDNAEFSGRIYGGSTQNKRTYENSKPLDNITMNFSTPLKQHSTLTGDQIDNREYNFRYAIPRDDGQEYGGRMRGKTMQVEMQSSSNLYDFSLQNMTTKYRISWA